jgi:hypothetical protein
MSGQVSGVLDPLADAIDNLDLPVDGRTLTDAFALADRLNAKLLAAVGDHDVAEVWRNDGATSMTAWLRHHTRAPHATPQCAPRPPGGCGSSPSPPLPTATVSCRVGSYRPSSPTSRTVPSA